MPSSLNDYSQQRVPDSDTVSSGHIALVIIGGTIAIPAFLMAAHVGNSLGFVTAMIAFVCGAFILGFMNACTSWVGSVTRLSASKLTENAFGLQGAKFINGLIAITLAGWYGVNCKMFGDAANTVLTSLGVNLPVVLYMVVGSLLMLWVSLNGFKGIDKLALWLVPMMVIFIFVAAYMAIDSPDADLLWQIKEDISFTSAVSAVVGAYIVGVVIQPDYSRFAKSPKGASVAAGMALLIVFPVVLVLTSIPAIVSQQSDLILVMVGIGIGGPAFFLLLLSSWSSNVLSLYSSSLSINTIVPAFSLKSITLFIGVLGTAIAFSDVQKYFIDFLILLGISIPPVGAIYCLNYWVNSTNSNEALSIKNNYWSAIYAWLGGCLFGWLSYQGYISITQVASLDSILCSAVSYLIFRKVGTAYSNKMMNKGIVN
jgi:cytosine permease